MRNGILFLVLSLTVISCGLSEIGKTRPGGTVGSIWGDAPGSSSGGGNSIMPVCYMTAVDYAKGYDWRTDAAKETVKCSLVVYTDGIPVMKVPVGAAHQVCSDPDMHRMVGGHLYTDCFSSGETILKKDGTLLFSYPTEERICDIRIQNGDVFTLGESRSGAGFSFRKNGETKVLRENGALMSPLRESGDSLSFAFCDEIRNATGSIMRYYTVYGSTVTQVGLRDDIVRVWDAVQNKDGIIYLASLVGLTQPVIISGEKMTALNMPAGATMISCSMLQAGEKTVVEGLYKTSDGVRSSAVWMNGVCIKIFKGFTISALCADGDGIFCVLNPSSSSSAGIIYRSGDVYEMPQGYACIGSQSMAVVGGIMHVGLSSLNGGRPLLWKDAQIDTIKINGYISSLVSDYDGL